MLTTTKKHGSPQRQCQQIHQVHENVLKFVVVILVNSILTIFIKMLKKKKNV